MVFLGYLAAMLGHIAWRAIIAPALVVSGHRFLPGAFALFTMYLRRSFLRCCAPPRGLLLQHRTHCGAAGRCFWAVSKVGDHRTALFYAGFSFAGGGHLHFPAAREGLKLEQFENSVTAEWPQKNAKIAKEVPFVFLRSFAAIAYLKRSGILGRTAGYPRCSAWQGVRCRAAQA